MRPRQPLIQFLCVFAFWGMMARCASAQITLDTVYVGDIGNPSDPTTGYGAVDYGYSIGKYEVTLDQYTAFLNAVGATDTHHLYHGEMASNPNIAGIARSGVAGSYTYSVVGSGARPVAYVGWEDAARFANWLQNGQPTGLQAEGTTETGAYTLAGWSGRTALTRNVGVQYGLPNEDEWYKAAYYQPVDQGGDTDDYWLYATRSNTRPNSRNGSTTDPNSANYFYDDGLDNGFNGGYAVNNSTVNNDNALTDAGAFSLASSFYGTFDQAGSVWEWNDAVISGSDPVLRGGSYNSLDESSMRASLRYMFYGVPSNQFYSIGFRVVMVPEPTVAGLMTLGVALLAYKRQRTF